MSGYEEIYDGGVRLIRGAELSPQTGQTQGAQRLVAIGPGAGAAAQANRLWMGRVFNEPGTRSLPHHHGEAETGGYILSGRARVYWGECYQSYVDLEKGDFCYVPAFLPHIEANLSKTAPLVFLTCRTPDNIVVNLDDVEIDIDRH